MLGKSKLFDNEKKEMIIELNGKEVLKTKPAKIPENIQATVIDLSQLDKDKTYLIGVEFKDGSSYIGKYEQLKYLSDIICVDNGFKNVYFYNKNDIDIDNPVDAKQLLDFLKESIKESKKK